MHASVPVLFVLLVRCPVVAALLLSGSPRFAVGTILLSEALMIGASLRAR